MIAAMLSSSVLLLQMAAAAAPAPPVLSTTPTPPIGARAEPTSMSGLPLQVGDLPPGTVAVRVIRQSFDRNVVRHPVELQVVGPNGTMREERTDEAGRATFPGLVVGSTVFVRTSLDGESLLSQQFELPARGGVRLVLVAGIGAGSASTPATAVSGTLAAPVPPVAALPANAARVAPAVMPFGSSFGSGISLIAVFVLVAAGAAVSWSTLRRRAQVASANDLFEALVELEHAHEAGDVTPDHYAARRELSIGQLARVRLRTSKIADVIAAERSGTREDGSRQDAGSEREGVIQCGIEKVL